MGVLASDICDYRHPSHKSAITTINTLVPLPQGGFEGATYVLTDRTYRCWKDKSANAGILYISAGSRANRTLTCSSSLMVQHPPLTLAKHHRLHYASCRPPPDRLKTAIALRMTFPLALSQSFSSSTLLDMASYDIMRCLLSLPHLRYEDLYMWSTAQQ